MKKNNQAKSVKSAVIWGIVSAVMYFMVFVNQQIITDYFTRGGIFAAAVIFTALAFSFAHGAFANYFIEVIGFKPVRKGGIKNEI